MKCKKGYKEKGNKCVKKPKSYSKKKVSYNPLKMFGSWIGLGGGFIYSYFIARMCAGGLTTGWINQNCSQPDLKISLFVAVMMFFIGWGIHSLIRRFKK